MLTKTLTAGVLAVSLSLTSLAPTRAAALSDEDVAVGIISLLLLGAAIHNNRDRSHAAPAPTTTPQPQANRGWRVLPNDCLRQTTRISGDRLRFFGQNCLRNNYAHMDRLPRQCHVVFRNQNGDRRQGYRLRCLENNGFRVSRH